MAAGGWAGGHPNRPVADGRSYWLAVDPSSRHDLAAGRIDPGDGARVRVRDPDRSMRYGDRGWAAPYGDSRSDRVRTAVDPGDCAVERVCHPERLTIHCKGAWPLADMDGRLHAT